MEAAADGSALSGECRRDRGGVRAGLGGSRRNISRTTRQSTSVSTAAKRTPACASCTSDAGFTCSLEHRPVGEQPDPLVRRLHEAELQVARRISARKMRDTGLRRHRHYAAGVGVLLGNLVRSVRKHTASQRPLVLAFHGEKSTRPAASVLRHLEFPPSGRGDSGPARVEADRRIRTPAAELQRLGEQRGELEESRDSPGHS